jgi:hypothetical protein
MSSTPPPLLSMPNNSTTMSGSSTIIQRRQRLSNQQQQQQQQNRTTRITTTISNEYSDDPITRYPYQQQQQQSQQQQQQQQSQQQHLALHMDNHNAVVNDEILDVYGNTRTRNHHNHYYYDPEQQQAQAQTQPPPPQSQYPTSPALSTSYSYPYHPSNQQYQNIGGTNRMTEEKLRRFQWEQQQHYHQKSHNQIHHRFQYDNPTVINEKVMKADVYDDSNCSTSMYGFYTNNYSNTNDTTNGNPTIPIWKRTLIQEQFYRPEDYHTIFRTPHPVTDAEYKTYLQQHQQPQQQHYAVSSPPSSLNRSITNNNNNATTTSTGTSMITKTCCAHTCSMFSAIAVLFLVWVGIVLDTQPLYIPGALPTVVISSSRNAILQQQQQQQQAPQSLSTTSSSTTVITNSSNQQQSQGQQQKKRQSQNRRAKSSNGNNNNNNSNSNSSKSRNRIQFIIPGKKDERLYIAKTAYQAAGLYFITMILCRYIYDPIPFHSVYTNYVLLLPCCKRWIAQRQRHHTYTTIPETNHRLPVAMTGLHSYDLIGHHPYATTTATSTTAQNASAEGLILGIDYSLPFSNTAASQQQRRPTTSSLYHTTMWSRTTNTMKRYLASKGWYPSRKFRTYEPKKTG